MPNRLEPYRYLLTYYLDSLRGRKKPLLGSLKLTHDCNLACAQCPFRKREMPSLSFSQARAAMQALHSGDIDAYDERVPPEHVPDLEINPDIEVKFSLSRFFRHLTLNCGRFPTNITGYRRAMAFGMDKNRINDEAIDGKGNPLDSYMPLSVTEWEIESSLKEHFYDPDFVSGNVSRRTFRTDNG